ncbi:unnamed protein product [Lactuca saligna]|uniref:R13L1/DRL21-like LRR repeat region domain-containing protein n=1 Tax=Lactuca saligna TaxID=75948 RepID=A0AA35YPC6_LACSI|nr:unnamed protein product [Lactuca saligna]
MKHLRYLNLSRTKIIHLPENVCNLYNLQTLIVSGCHELIKLPESFSKLKNLQHFDMRGSFRLKKMPLGIGELKSLQTLFTDIGLAITELTKLQSLHGKVCIVGLSNVQNAMDARAVNLSRMRFSELELNWGSEFNSLRTETHEREVLNELKPHNNTLKKLEIVSYRGIEFPNWVGDPSFLRLTKVSIDDCEECTSLPRLGQLPSLRKLIIGWMSKVKVVGLEFLRTGLAFPSLEILRFSSMSGWEEWSTNSGAFPCLQEIRIEDCPNLVRVSLEALPSLRVVKLIKCDHGLLKSLVDAASSIAKLKIDDISGLTDELWRGVTGYLGAFEYVSIKRCNDIRYLWGSEAEASMVLMNLKMLDLRECKILVSLGEKEEDIINSGSNLTSFRILKVSDCNSLEHCSCPNSMEDLDIGSCDSITSVSFPTGGMQKLRLTIIECSSMESFPDHELPNLTSLTYLDIQKCTSTDASFPRGLWPLKLTCLEIGGLKKPISEWGPQNFPTSLVDLRLYGGPYDDIRSFGELLHLLPSSLTDFVIDGFEKLESVSSGLQHLTSLQRLIIQNCPKTTDLPENLLPLLLVLWIEGCPNLKERISRGGIYWPHVSLIPCLRIDRILPNEI